MKLLDNLEQVDLIFAFGGEPTKGPYAHARSGKAAWAYTQTKIQERRDGPAPILLSGYCSGTLLPHQRPSRDQAEAYQMRRHLMEVRGVPDRHVHTEAEALDTLANIILSWPIIDGLGAKNLALVADKPGMERVLDTAQYVLGTKYRFFPLPVREHDGPQDRGMVDRIVSCAIHTDGRLRGLIPGDQIRWEVYLKNGHPFHHRGSKVRRYASAYGFGVLAKDLLDHGSREVLRFLSGE